MASLFESLRRWRYGAVGSALAGGLVVFGVAAGIAQISGLKGGLSLFLAVSLAANAVAFSIYHYIRVEHLLLLQRTNLGSRISASSETLGRKGIIGIVAPISSWPTMFYVDLIRSIREAAEREKDDVQRRLLVIDIPREEFSLASQAVIHRVINNIDGLISININFPDDMSEALRVARVPVVNVHHEKTGPPFVTSLIPDHGAFDELMQHLLIEKECTTAIMVTKGLANPFKNVQVDHFRKAKRDIFIRAARLRGLEIQTPTYLLEFNEPIRPGNAYIIEIDRYTASNGQELFQRIEGSCPRSTAIICLADDVAMGFLDSCSQAGRSAQARGFRVSGVDNCASSKWFDLTTIDYELQTVGYLAYSRLQAVLERPGTTNYVVESVKTTLIKRGTTDW